MPDSGGKKVVDVKRPEETGKAFFSTTESVPMNYIAMKC